MANSIDLTTIFLALLDEIYKIESLTSRLDALTQPEPAFDGTAIVKVMKLSTIGLGTYARATGYPAGDITATWETLTLACERGRSFTLDRMDNEESLGLVLGNIIRTWMREQVAPEIDAYRFAKYATGAGGEATPATLDKTTVLGAIDAASQVLDDAEVPTEGRLLYISSPCKRMLDQAVTRMYANESSVDRRLKMLDELTIIPVPQARFYSEITLNAGATGNAGGYVKNVATGKDMNFLMLHPSACKQATKLNQVKYFSPEVNQHSDGHLWQYRLYHDAFIMENKNDGIYTHHKA